MAKQIDGTEFACLTINADLEAENEKLKKQLALTEKALELAVGNCYCPYNNRKGCPCEKGASLVLDEECNKCALSYFLSLAEKEMSNGI